MLYTGELTSCNLAMFYSKLHLCLEQPQTPSTCSRHVELEVRGGGAVTLSHYDKHNAPTIGHSNSNRGPLLGLCNMHCRLVRMGILLFIHFLNSTHTIARNWPSTTATTTMAGSNEAGSSGGPFRFFWHDPTSRLGWLRVRLYLVSGRILVPRQAMSA